MDKPSGTAPVSPKCFKCGEQPRFTSSMLEATNGRTYHLFECVCGDKSWISEKT